MRLKAFITIFVFLFSIQSANALDYTEVIHRNMPKEVVKSCSQNIKASITEATNKGELLSIAEIVPHYPNMMLFRGVVSLYFLDVLENLPEEIDTIALELPAGGDAIASIIIAEKIRAMGLGTYAGLTFCHSACTIIYQGGATRGIDPAGYFTYHGVGGGVDGDNCSAAIQDNIKSRLSKLDLVDSVLKDIKAPWIYSGLPAKSEKGVATYTDRRLIGSDLKVLEKYPDL